MDKPSKISTSKKWVWISVGTLLGLALLFFGSLPSILSTDVGKGVLIRSIEGSSGATLSIDTLRLGWSGEQRIEKLTYKDSQGMELSLETVTSSCSFWNLLFRDGSIGKTTIDAPRIVAVAKAPETAPKKPKTIVESAKKPPKPLWSDFSGNLIVKNGHFTVKGGQGELIQMKKVFLDIDLGEVTQFKLQGETDQSGRAGQFIAQGREDKFLEGNAAITNFPIEGLDTLAGIFVPRYRGLLLATLGDTLNANLSAVPQGSNLALSLSVRSPRLLVDLAPQYTGDTFVLKNPGRVVLTIVPALFNHFSKDLMLKNQAQGELRLDEGTLPFDKKLKPNLFSGIGNLYFSGATFALKEVSGALFLDQLNLDFNTEELGKLVDMRVKSAMRYGDAGQSMIEGAGGVANLFGKRSFPTLDLEMAGVPLAFADSFMKQKLSSFLGNTLDARAIKTKELLTLSGMTPLLQFSDLTLNLGDDARLSGPSSFVYRVTPSLYEGLTWGFNLNGTINALTIPIKAEALAFSEAAFETVLSAGEIELKKLGALGGVVLPFFNSKLKGTFDSIDFKGESQLNFVRQSWGQSLFGRAVGLKTEGTASIDGQVDISPLTLSLSSDKFKGTLEGAIENNLFLLKKGVGIDALLDPAFLNLVLAKESEYPLLQKPAPIRIEIKPSQFPLKEGAGDVVLKGSGKVHHLELMNPANRYPFMLENVGVDFDLNEAKDLHNISLEGSAFSEEGRLGDLSLSLTGKGKVGNLVASPETVTARLDNFSSKIADLFFGTRGQLPGLVGPTIDVKYGMEKMGNGQAIDLYLNGKELTLDGSFIAGKTLELRSPRKPLKIDWNISERSYDAFRRWRNPDEPLTSNNPLITIQDQGKLSVQVSPLSLPLKESGDGFPKVDLNLYESLFGAKVRIDDLKFQQGQGGPKTELSRFDLSVGKNQRGDKPLTFKFDGKISGGAGKVQGDGTLKDFLSIEGTLDLSNVTTSIHASIDSLPSVFFDALSKLDQGSEFSPSAFLGDTFNATFDAEVEKSQGTVTMDVDATACRATFSGLVSQGTLYLKEPLKALFTITPQLNNVLERSAKLNVAAMEKPITLYIHDEGFQVPLKNLHIRNMSFNYGQLDLGEIMTKNAGSASEVGDLFKIDAPGNRSIWFAPAEFNMQSGKLYLDRTEILYNRSYQVCLWGKVKFPKRYVDMTLGLTAQALRSALGIQDISDDYVLKVPVEGPFANVRIDTGAATSKIAFLVARKHVAPQLGTFGQILGAIGDLTDNQSDVPPPKPPFPWQQSN